MHVTARLAVCLVGEAWAVRKAKDCPIVGIVATAAFAAIGTDTATIAAADQKISCFMQIHSIRFDGASVLGAA